MTYSRYHKYFFDDTPTPISIMCYNMNPVEFCALGKEMYQQRLKEAPSFYAKNSLGIYYKGRSENSQERSRYFQ